MVVTTYGKEYTTIRMGSNIPALEYTAIGSGSGAVAISDTTLFNEVDRQAFTGGSIDFTVSKKITTQSNWNSIEMSGISLTEVGLVASGAAGVGSILTHNGFTAVEFDGTNELQIENTIEIF